MRQERTALWAELCRWHLGPFQGLPCLSNSTLCDPKYIAQSPWASLFPRKWETECDLPLLVSFEVHSGHLPLPHLCNGNLMRIEGPIPGTSEKVFLIEGAIISASLSKQVQVVLIKPGLPSTALTSPTHLHPPICSERRSPLIHPIQDSPQ